MQNEDRENRHQDEIDLGQLLGLMGKGINKIVISILRLFNYFKRNILKFIVLIIVGGLVGFGLNKIFEKRLTIEVIVIPNAESKIYLYDVVNEIGSNIKSKDSIFFNKLNININDLRGFGVEISAAEQEQVEDIDDKLKYLEMLEKFRDESGIIDVVRNEIASKTTLNHRINFYFKDAVKGREIVQKLMNYINSNNYYNELVEVYSENAKIRIKKDQELLDQIDNLIAIYSDELRKEDKSDATVILNDSEKLNITGLFRLKNELIRDIETKKIEIQTKKEAIQVVSFGSVQQVQKSFFSRTIVLIPTILILLFILWDILKAINRRASEL